MITAPIKGRRSGLRVNSLRIRTPDTSSTMAGAIIPSTTPHTVSSADPGNPDFGIYADLNSSPPSRLPQARAVSSTSSPSPSRTTEAEAEDEASYSLHTTSRIEADDEGGFRYLPHSVSASRPSGTVTEPKQFPRTMGAQEMKLGKVTKALIVMVIIVFIAVMVELVTAETRKSTENARPRKAALPLGGPYLAFPSGATINQNQLDRKTIAALVTAAVAVKEVMPIMMNTTGGGPGRHL